MTPDLRGDIEAKSRWERGKITTLFYLVVKDEYWSRTFPDKFTDRVPFRTEEAAVEYARGVGIELPDRYNYLQWPRL